MTTAVDLARPLRGHASLVREMHERADGSVLLETVFKYPDGTSIEALLAPPNGLGQVGLTDLGQTTSWLLDLGIKPWLSAKRRALQDDALRTYGVERKGGELVLDVAAEPGAVADGVVRLAQACLRTADLMFTRRTALQSAFTEDVEEIIGDLDLPYESGVEVPGRKGHLVRVDFSVQGARTKSLVLTLSSQNLSAAKAHANAVFAAFYDLSGSSRPEQRVTLFDDRSNAIRGEDLERIGDVSQVVPFSDPSLFRAIVAA
jgi:hypothetical protein